LPPLGLRGSSRTPAGSGTPSLDRLLARRPLKWQGRHTIPAYETQTHLGEESRMREHAGHMGLWLPVVIYCVAIFALSSFEQPPKPQFLPDKWGHLILFAGLGFLFARFVAGIRNVAFLQLLTVTALFCLIYAITDEGHQYFVPGRTSEIGDLTADTIGGFLGAPLYITAR
jgi:VanZ family protein